MTSERYNARESEPRWQRQWDEKAIFASSNDDPRPKYYVLEMFPYPSGDMHMGHAEAFDPKLLYDHFHQRWLFVTLADGQSTASALMIAVSSTSDPTGDWTLFDVDADSGNTLWPTTQMWALMNKE